MTERSPTLRILMTADAVGGVWSYALDLATALAPAGIAVTLATMGPRPDAAQRAAAARVPGLRLLESDYRLEWMEEPWEDVARAGEWLLALEREHAPDLVHLNGYAHAALPWRAPVLVVAHSCILSWWEAVKAEPAPPRFARYRVAVAQGLAAADAVVAPTRWMADEITRHYGAPQRSRVIANGSEVVRFAPAAKAPVVFAAGRFWDEGKNLRALDAAAAMLGAEVRVAGDLTGTDGRSVAPVHATALGHLSPDAIAAELAQAAVYALPARYEPFGLSVLEAAASGCALVLGDIPSLHETWGDAALYVPPDDPGALAVTIADLLADEARRSALAAAALRRSRDLTAARMASRYCALYRELAGAQAAIAATG